MQISSAQLAALQALFLDTIYKQFMHDMHGRVTNIYLPKPCPKLNQQEN